MTETDQMRLLDRISTALQIQNAVYAYLTSKQILPFVLAVQHLKTKQLQYLLLINYFPVPTEGQYNLVLNYIK